MYKIYIYKDYNKEIEDSKSLIKKYAADFDGSVSPADLDVVIDEKGKPYFLNSNLQFSISHSDCIWGAVIGDGPCGLDIQETRECQYMKLAQRFFSEKETLYVEKGGLPAYYKLWTRREAIGKFMGEGFFMRKRPELVDEKGELLDYINNEELEVTFYQLEVEDGFEAVWCSGVLKKHK